MDPRLAYWTLALVNMFAVVGFALAGVQAVRRGDTELHRRRMLVSASLVVLFVLSYVVKLAVIGREHRSSWGMFSIWVLRIHELCVLTMVLAGALAIARGLRLRATRSFTRRPQDPAAPASVVRSHRGAGRTAAIAAALGFALAVFVLAGMYRRAGIF